MKNFTIDSKLLFAQNAITNALGSEEIKSAIANYGYDDIRLQEGEALYTKASELQAIQAIEYGEQYSATDALHLARAVANKSYMHVKIARIALIGDRGAGASLQLDGLKGNILRMAQTGKNVLYQCACFNGSDHSDGWVWYYAGDTYCRSATGKRCRAKVE